MDYHERLALVEASKTDYPFMACAPASDPLPASVSRDPVLNQEYVVVPFTGPRETGWAVWMFPRAVLRDTFVRRYRKAEVLTKPHTVTTRRSAEVF